MMESIVERIQKFLLSCLPEKGQPTMTVLRIKDVLESVANVVVSWNLALIRHLIIIQMLR